MVQRIKERTLYRQTVDRFINYLSRVYKRKTEYRCNAQDVTAWNNWVEYYGKSVGRDLAWKHIKCDTKEMSDVIIINYK